MTNDSMLLKEERETLHRGRYEGYAPCFISSVLYSRAPYHYPLRGH